MMIKVTIQGGVVQDVETSEPATVQIVGMEEEPVSTFNTVAQIVAFEYDPEEPGLTAMPLPIPEVPALQ